MARIRKNVTTPDGVLHPNPCYITGRLQIDHGSTFVRDIDPSDRRSKVCRRFTFNANVQAFHSQADAESGAKPIMDAGVTVAGKDAEYFAFAGRTLAQLFPGETDFSKLTLAEVIDAAVWAAATAKGGGKFDAAERASLGDCVFTNPAVSPFVDWN